MAKAEKMSRAEKKANKAKKEKKQGRLRQIALVYKMSKETDPRLGLILLGVFVPTAAVAFAVFFFAVPGGWPFDIVTALLLGLLATMVVFSRRAQRAQYRQIEGQPGAAAAALNQLRRGWKVDPAIAFNKSQDIVHRVVGPPGIVLVGEGNPARLKNLLAAERRKHERVVAETPIFEVLSGDAPGAVPVPKLSRHVSKLGRNIKPAEMTDVLQRLKALDSRRSPVPMPKGPVPTSLKGARQNMRGR